MTHPWTPLNKFFIWTTWFSTSLFPKILPSVSPLPYNLFFHYQTLPEPQPRAKPSGLYLLRKRICTWIILQEKWEKSLAEQEFPYNCVSWQRASPNLAMMAARRNDFCNTGPPGPSQVSASTLQIVWLCLNLSLNEAIRRGKELHISRTRKFKYLSQHI